MRKNGFSLASLGPRYPPSGSAPTVAVAKATDLNRKTRNPETLANWALRQIPAQSQFEQALYTSGNGRPKTS